MSSLPVEQGIWEYSDLYRDILVAKEWGLTPEEFWSKSKTDRLLMTAFIEVDAHIRAFEIRNDKK